MHMKASDYAHASKRAAVRVLDDFVVPCAMHVCRWWLLDVLFGLSHAALSGHRISPAIPCLCFHAKTTG